VRQSRVISGFLKKKGRNKIGNKIGIHHDRWVFLMSSRPLNQEEYMNDTDNLSEEHLPTLIDFDTVYYYTFDNEKDDSLCLGSVKTVDIFLENLNIQSLSSDEHVFTLDVGKKKYEFIAPTKFLA
jgi:hypothetical protein